MESRKLILMKLFAERQWKHRYREQTYGHGGWGREEGEGGRYGERNMETYITICEIDSQRKLAVRVRELKQVLHNNLERWDGEEDGGGNGVQEGGDICIPMADSC